MIELEHDDTSYGSEITYADDKGIRDGMRCPVRASDVLDLVITHKLIVDHWGIERAGIGIRDGRVGIRGTGNQDAQDGVEPRLDVGIRHAVIVDEKYFVPAGKIDSHIHFIGPQMTTDDRLTSGLQSTDNCVTLRRTTY